MFVRSSAVLLIYSLLCSVAFCQEQKIEPPSASQAKVMFYRATGYAGHMLHASIKIDSEKNVHKVPDNHIWVTELFPGSHFISGDDKRYGMSYPLEGGKTYYFRIEAIQGKTQLKFRVLSVSAETADTEMRGLQPE